MRSRVIAAVLYGALVCLAPACSSDEEPGTDDPGTQDQVPIFPDGGDDGGPPDPQAFGPITLPPFGGPPGVPNTISEWLAALQKACGDGPCPTVQWQPEGVQPTDECTVSAIEPVGVTVERNSTITITVDCPEAPPPEENGESEGGVPPEEDGGEVVPPEDGG